MVVGNEDQEEGVVGSGVGPGEVLDRLRDPVLGLDDAGSVTHVNRQAENLIAGDAADAVGTTLDDALPWLAGRDFRDAFDRAMERQDPARFETYHEARGVHVEVRLHPSPSGVTLQLRDVTERDARKQTLTAGPSGSGRSWRAWTTP